MQSFAHNRSHLVPVSFRVAKPLLLALQEDTWSVLTRSENLPDVKRLEKLNFRKNATDPFPHDQVFDLLDRCAFFVEKCPSARGVLSRKRPSPHELRQRLEVALRK